MFPKVALTVVLVILPAFLVVADVTPTNPGPGYVANAGSNCNIGWNGDTSSPTAWKSMSIQLMTGDNFNMIPLTTVVENLDGTKTGTFVWTCPQVTPNSAIYFYQFTSPNTPNKQWTTRFTIASSSGASTPPPNPTQPGGQAIPWGVGQLNVPSTAVPPPSYLGSGGSSSSSSNSPLPGSSSASSNSTSTPSTLTVPPGTTAALPGAGSDTTSSSISSTVVVVQTTTAAASKPTSSTNSAVSYGPFVPGFALSICASVFAVLF